MGTTLPKVQTPRLKADQAHRILVWFFGRTSITPKQLTKDDRIFAERLLLEAIKRSIQMGWVEALFRSYAKIPSGPRKVIKEFAKQAAKQLRRYGEQDDIEKWIKEPGIYKSVKSKLAVNFKSVWKIREQAGSLIY